MAPPLWVHKVENDDEEDGVSVEAGVLDGFLSLTDDASVGSFRVAVSSLDTVVNEEEEEPFFVAAMATCPSGATVT